MSSSRPERRVVIVGLAALAGCGFAPVYGPNGPARALRGTVLVEAPSDRDEFNLVTQLDLRLGQTASAAYALDYTLTISQDGVGLTSAQETTRYNVVGAVAYQLKEIATGKVLTSGRVTNFTGYSVGTVDTSVSPPSTSSTVSTRAAERDAYDRLMVMLADQVVTNLVAASADWAK